jgi:uncharacterized membrane protein YphA (DoxX/SURF4 family)
MNQMFYCLVALVEVIIGIAVIIGLVVWWW